MPKLVLSQLQPHVVTHSLLEGEDTWLSTSLIPAAAYPGPTWPT